MQRFYVPQEIKGDSLSISTPELVHHIKDVLRLRPGDAIIFFDSTENEYTAVVRTLKAREVTVEITGRRSAAPKKVRIAIACAIPKKVAMDEVIDTLTQLGVDTIIPMETERVVVRLDEGKKEARLRRWRRVAQSAAEQSQRSSIPNVEPVTAFSGVIANAGQFAVRLIPHLSGQKKHIRDALAAAKPESVLVLIGPEGDFTEQEVAAAVSAGFIPVSLGDSVLRVATAAAAVAAYLRLSLEG